MIALPRRRDVLIEWLAPLPLVLVMAVAGLLFGGVAWWFRPLAVAGVGLATTVGVLRLGFLRARMFLRSPLLFFMCVLWCWTVLQLAPLPRAIISRVAPMSDQVYAKGLMPTDLTADAISTPENLEIINSRIPISLNRSEGIRRIVYLSLGIATFWFVGIWTDRQSKLLMILGLIVMFGMLHSAAVMLQMLDGSTGILGMFQPDQRYFVGPGWVDSKVAPHWTTLEKLPMSNSNEFWPIARMEALGLIGMMPGGLASFAALQAVAMPAMVGCIFFLTQRRGSRFDLMERLRDRGMTTLWGLLFCSLFISSLILGSTGSLIPCIPVVLGVLCVCVCSLRSDIEKWFVLAVTIWFLSGLSLGFITGNDWNNFNEYGFEWIWSDSSTFNTFLTDARSVWQHSGWTGIGLGAYASVSSYWKHSFVNPTDAPSSALELLIETGLPALLLMTAGGAWLVWRLVRSIGKSEQEHRCLTGAVIGSALGLIVGWLLLAGWQIPLLTLMSFSVLGLADRSLSGARDLYVEAWDTA